MHRPSFFLHPRFAVVPVAVLWAASFGALDPSWGDQEPPATTRPPLDLEQQYELVLQTHRELPSSFRTLTTAEAESLSQRLEKALQACRTYLSGSKNEPRKAEVRVCLARYLYLLSRRYEHAVRTELQGGGSKFDVEKLRARMSEYHGLIARHAREGYAGLERSSALRPEALELAGRGAYGAQDYEEARTTFQKFLDEFPGHESTAAIASALGRTYLRLERYEEGIALVERVWKDRRVYDSPSYPYLGEVLWKLQEAKGDLDGMLAAVRTVQTVYPLRMRGEDTSSSDREDLDRYLIFSGFRLGYVQLARGEIDLARAAFREHIADLDSRRAALREKGKALPPFAEIYQKRSRDSLRFIEEIGFRPAPAPLDLSGMWVTDRKIAPRKAGEQRVLALVFRGVGDRRSATFLERLDEYCAESPDVDLLCVSYLKGSTNVPEQIDTLRDELGEMGFEGAAGFDPDPRKGLFRAYGANVGSATFYVLDRDGRPVWFEQDPRTVDVNLARTIVDRARKTP